ncbi:MAG TPA: cytochrome P450, partial [Dongiaceae bacterium]|nr:cytochrome P450 [Dongiaceae bacterium]
MSAIQSAPTSTMPLQDPPKLKGGLPLLGHMLPFARNPFLFMKKVSDQVGEIAQFKIFSQRMVLLTGDEASKLFYRSSDEQLDQSAAYKLMTPIFGEGIIFDAPIARKDEQLKMLMPSLRMEAMRNHSGKIVQEVDDMMKTWGDSGEIELVEEMKQLTINTASHCLLGREFRYELTGEFASIYHDLERGVNALAYSFPNLPIPAFRARDRARIRLHQLVGDIVKKREQQTEKPTDMFQMLIDARYEDGGKLTTNEITGMLVGAIFAGHHTSSGTAAWVLLELLKHPNHLREVREELDNLLGSDGAVTFQSMREVPKLENVLKEVLRLHPPLIVLMRQVSEPLVYKNFRINVGDMVWAAPPVTHRMSHLFA